MDPLNPLNPVQFYSRSATAERCSSSSSVQASIGMLSVGATQPRSRAQESINSSSIIQSRDAWKHNRNVQGKSMDPLMNRLQYQYPMKPNEYLYGKVPHASEEPSASMRKQTVEKAENSMKAVQDETVSMLSRYLPRITTAQPTSDSLSIDKQGSTDEKFVDDRITPKTLQALLQKGCNIATKFAGQKSAKRRHLPVEEKISPNAHMEALRTQVKRLEPPFVEYMLQAKVFDRSRSENDPTPREVLPITSILSKEKKKEQASPDESNSKLITSSSSPLRKKENKSQRRLSMVSSNSSSLSADEANTTLRVPLTRSTNVGDDSGIIEQLVAYAAARRRPSLGSSDPSKSHSGIPSCHPSYKPIFSALDAVLSVSKEYEKVQQTWPGGTAMHVSATRQGIINRITSLESSRVPRDLWVTIHSPTFPGSRRHWEHDVEKVVGRIPAKSSLLFPAVKATGRAQVYLLGDTLDRMFQDIPDALAVLADKNIAQRLLPEPANDESINNKSSRDVERLLNPEALQESDTAHVQYVEAAKHIMEIVDIGLVELVRQIAGSCAERGALLDALRLVITDVTSSALWLLGYCKEQARHEAKARRDLIVDFKKDVEDAVLLREEVRNMRVEVENLRRANGELEGKASKYDTLMERLQLKDKNFSKHSPEHHLSLLMELEESYTHLTTKGLEELYDMSNVLFDEKDKVGDAPTTQMNNLKINETVLAKNELYIESYRLLSALTDALQAVDGACQPLYESLTLPKPTSTVNVASMKWADIARVVGSFEAEKKHRQHVFDVFSRWNAIQDSNDHPTRISSSTGRVTYAEDGENNKQRDLPITAGEGGKEEGDVIKGTTTTMNEIQTIDSKSPQGKITQRRRLRPITRADLMSMGITDCTPEEVNALYDLNLDMANYLRPTWIPPGEYELTAKVIRDMVHDVSDSLRHITLRMNSLASSTLLKDSLKPLPRPPERPDDPCSLCGRRDTVAMEKRNKGEALQRVAMEVQRRYEELMKKCQKAEADRENYHRDLQRFQIREKRQVQEWVQRESELRQANAALVEENREMAQRIFLLMQQVKGEESHHSDSSDSQSDSSHGSAGSTHTRNV
ncbi:uncharacterized protein TM35_000301430 [Trypanosoma theileri]|uniref:Uncharacterized protein n=1 Tax=Trypanosoma theileri TaxID=67003 RepID=A0A1X0NNL9_9TRYP|nr:uncharacterized protein TM35_000301430 [Trypanosoma theileri]ORC86103.1 hypothetical protein TM35_000301430 [Trypanosoma theileri]